MDVSPDRQALGLRYHDIAIRENQRISPLLKLPAELRNRIYEDACLDGVVSAGAAIIKDRRALPSLHGKAHQASSALLHVCRQIRHEMMPIFVDHTTFEFTVDFDAFKSFVNTWRLRNTVRSIKLHQPIVDFMTFSWVDAKWRKGLEHSLHLPSLEHVHVHLGQYVDLREWREDSFSSFCEAARMTFGREGLTFYITEEEVPEEWEDIERSDAGLESAERKLAKVRRAKARILASLRKRKVRKLGRHRRL